MGRGQLWFSNYLTTSDPGGNFSKMPTFLRSGAWVSSQLLVSSIPVLTSLPSLDLRGDRSPRVTSGPKRGSTGSESRAAASVDCTKAGRVKLLWDSRERPQLRSYHARPCGQVPTNHCGAYTNSGQSAFVLFPSPARSSQGSPNSVPAPTVAAVAFAAAASGADSGIPAPGSLPCPC